MPRAEVDLLNAVAVVDDVFGADVLVLLGVVLVRLHDADGEETAPA